MSRLTLLLIAAPFVLVLDLIGVFVFGFKPMSGGDAILLVFVSAWAGEKRSKSDTAQGGGNG